MDHQDSSACSRKKTHKTDQQETLSSKTHQRDKNEETALPAGEPELPAVFSEAVAEEGGRERLKRHRVDVAGRVWIPDRWGQEDLLKDWIDCSAFDASLVPNGIMSARQALAEEGRRANSSGLRIENRC